VASRRPLKHLARSAAEGGMDAIRGIEKPVIAEERQWQHHLLASNLETPT